MFNELFLKPSKQKSKQQDRWRFIENGYGTDNGLDSADMETFKKDPISSLARESCQNSIDAQKGTAPVLMQFKPFYIKTAKIPGVKELTNEIKACRDTNVEGSKQYRQFESMLNLLSKEDIPCLRISDFNTTGLDGVSGYSREKAFYRLTKGNGQTTKENGTTGGSKGIGKFASFVASQLQTVFYSTLNMDGDKGYLGITKLASRPLDEDWLCTTGYGYYSHTEKVLPILEDLRLDANFVRHETGTDIYIIGFKMEDDWKKEIITKVLDSFMCAIQYNKLNVEVDDVLLNKENLKNVIYDERYIAGIKDKRNIISQYILLNNDYVYRKEFTLKEYGKIEVFVREFQREEEYLATKKCIMVRYPYMRITDFHIACAVPCSALCIIPDNLLNRKLRDIENPQHTDWEYKRIDNPTERKETKKLLTRIEKMISDYANECLLKGKSKEIDMEGASNFLPSFDQFEDGSLPLSKTRASKSKIVNMVKNKVKDRPGEVEDDTADSSQPDLGSYSDDGGEAAALGSGGQSHHAKGKNTQASGQEKGHIGEGKDIVMKSVQLTGIKSKIFVVHKEKGEYAIVFHSIYDEDQCELELYYLDDAGRKYQSNILACRVNGVDGAVQDGKISDLQIKKGQKYKISVLTDMTDIYACEVKLYALR